MLEIKFFENEKVSFERSGVVKVFFIRKKIENLKNIFFLRLIRDDAKVGSIGNSGQV